MVWACTCCSSIIINLHQSFYYIESRLLSEVSITLCVVTPETGAHERSELDVILLIQELVSHVTTVFDYTLDDEFDDVVVAVVRSKVKSSGALFVAIREQICLRAFPIFVYLFYFIKVTIVCRIHENRNLFACKILFCNRGSFTVFTTHFHLM